ncbi:MAG: SRPBCC family protein [Dehalococcoidia bacterium]|nr:SRPBCC family protein [Dehalococcoidia bacterium]
MKFRFSSSVDIKASPAEVWALAVKLEEWPEWTSAIKRIERLSDGSLGVGSRLRVLARSLITVQLIMTITEFVPEKRLYMKGRVLGMEMTRWYTLEQVDGRTRLTAGGEVSGLLAPLVRRGGQRLSEDIVRDARKRVESLK